MNEKQIHNLKTYINWLPAIGAVSSLISFFYFFLIVNVELNLNTILYCLMPFFVFTMVHIPAKILIKKRNKDEQKV